MKREVELVGGVAPVARGAVASVSIGGVGMKLYMRKTLTLVKYSKSWKDAEAAAEVLKALGVSAEARRVAGGFWRAAASVGRLAAGAPELRETLARAVREAAEAGLVPEAKARRWLDALESGRVPLCRYVLALTRKKGLMVRYVSTNPGKVEREAQRLRDMGLVERLHFTVKMPGGGRPGYVYIRREGLRRIATAAARGNAAAVEFVEFLLQRAEEAGGAVYEKVEEVVEEGRAVGARRLSGMRAEVEVWGRRHAVAVLSWDADWNSRRLHVSILAEVDGVKNWYTATFYKTWRGYVAGYAYARATVLGGRKADAKRFATVVKAVTGKEPKMYVMGTKLKFSLGQAHLDGFAQYAELADIVESWLVGA